LWSQNCPNTENFTQLEVPVIKFSMGLSEYSFQAHELDSTEKFVPIPPLNEDKAKYSRGVRPTCPNTENITPLELHGVKFSMTLPEHSFHGEGLNSSDKHTHSTFERGKSKMGLWSQNCMSKYRKYYTT
jgi:hypothetical protein